MHPQDISPPDSRYQNLLHHPDRFADFLYSKQLFVTTHSPFFVNSLSPEEVWVLEKQEDGFSTITRASEIDYVKNLYESEIELGDLWYSNYFG